MLVQRDMLKCQIMFSFIRWCTVQSYMYAQLALYIQATATISISKHNFSFHWMPIIFVLLTWSCKWKRKTVPKLTQGRLLSGVWMYPQGCMKPHSLYILQNTGLFQLLKHWQLAAIARGGGGGNKETPQDHPTIGAPWMIGPHCEGFSWLAL